jgi:hypothetical protein
MGPEKILPSEKGNRRRTLLKSHWQRFPKNMEFGKALSATLSKLSLHEDHHHQCAATVAMMDAVVRADGDMMNTEDVLDALPHN